eukprot:764907-Hanusia_phi.AAC.2
MDAIRSWLTANCAQVSSGGLVCDPFAGSGALLQAAKDMGATFTLGSDVQSEFGGSTCLSRDHLCPVGSLAIDVLADISRCPWVGRFDAIVCDPPYGRSTSSLPQPDLNAGRRAGQVYCGEEELDFGILSSLLRWADVAMAPQARLA